VIAIRSEEEIALLRQADQLVADILATLAENVAPGVRTSELEAIAAEMIRAAGAKPAFLGYHGYPACTCISVDEVIVHGIPGKRKLEDGQIVSMDVGVCWNGYYGDAAVSVACGEVDETRARLMAATDEALARGIAAARHGNFLSDVGRAIQETAEAAGFAVVRDFVGHGIGQKMHEEPQIPNFATGQKGPMLRSGMVFALEPMVNAGTHEVRVLKDGWTAATKDRKPSAHFEHSIVVREDGGEILSDSPRLRWGRLGAYCGEHGANT
jgi:methionyl aminopeptidase